MSEFSDQFRNRRVLVTGHTGFKGAWLCEWLIQLGAKVAGLALSPPTNPSLFEQLSLGNRITHYDADVRSFGAVSMVIEEFQPEFIFHLAAQSLVRTSYAEPVDTYATNVMGTVNVLEALRKRQEPCTIVVVTTDKCYRNNEWDHGYRESDPLGGYDPYSSSKAACELVVSAYRNSFFDRGKFDIRLASARAGNVMGGGDWALDRIVPDCMRALQGDDTIEVRNRHATRPWQHVLEPLSGYLWLAASLSQSDSPELLSSSFNFGPNLDSNKSVQALVEAILRSWPGGWSDRSDPEAPHEAGRLNLSIEKAHHQLGWSPVWRFEETIRQTVEWYREVHQSHDLAQLKTRNQMLAYVEAARRASIIWAAI